MNAASICSVGFARNYIYSIWSQGETEKCTILGVDEMVNLRCTVLWMRSSFHVWVCMWDVQYDILRKEAWIDLHIEYKQSVVFGGGQRTFEVKRGQIMKKRRSLEPWTDLIFGMSVYPIECKKLIVFGVGQRSKGIKLWKPCKHDISRREASKTDIICSMLVTDHIECKMPILSTIHDYVTLRAEIYPILM